MADTKEIATSYARQYPFEANERLGSLSFAMTTDAHNYRTEIMGHPVVITFEEDHTGNWHKRIRVFPDRCNSLIPEVVDHIALLVDERLTRECVTFSRPMDPEE